MSNEPEKQSRAWVWWAVIALLLLAYPLSEGPALRLSWATGHGNIMKAYRPVDWLESRSPIFDRFMAWWEYQWGFRRID
jgi:hypothetical protein